MLYTGAMFIYILFSFGSLLYRYPTSICIISDHLHCHSPIIFLVSYDEELDMMILSLAHTEETTITGIYTFV